MKNLIIVCDEKHRKYGDFLAQLVSLEDDKEDRIVGTKDGSVAAQVWLEKYYKANSATISSNQYLLFIGNGKLAKEKRAHMQLKFDHFGMRYGWLGKQANISVGDPVDIEDYDNFYDYAFNNQSRIERLIEQKDVPEDNSELPVVQEEEKKGGLPAQLKKVPAMGLIAIKQLKANKKITEQQYSCLTYVFYLNGLSEFLGLQDD